MSAEDDIQTIEDLLNDMRMEKIPIEKIVPNPKNPRVPLKPGIPMYDKLHRSISKFKYSEPIIWNERTGMIVAGHQRFQVMQDIANEKGLTLSTISVVVVNMEPAEEEAFMVASNKITGIWDNEKLADLFGDMDEEWKEVTGFDSVEIENLMGDAQVDLDQMFIADDGSGIQTEKKKKKVTCPHCGKEFEI